MSLKYYDLEHDIYKALQGWCPDDNDPDALGGFGSLIRTGAVTEQRKDSIRVRVMSFSIGIEDYSAMIPYLTVKGDYDPAEYDPLEYQTKVPIVIT
jgi:hypothetical protein